LGLVSYQLGQVIQGAAYLEEAVPILRELDDRQGLVNTLANLTLRALTDTAVLGEVDYLQLAHLGDEALQVARSFHWDQGEVLALLQAAISLDKAGEYGQALDRLVRAQARAEASRNRESFARFHLIFGELHYGLFAFAEAKQHFETALACLQELGSGLLLLGAKARLALVAIVQDDTARAHALLADLLPAEFPDGHEQFSLRRCWAAAAELELAHGNPRRALEIVDRLLAATPDLAQYGPHAVPRFSRLRGQALAALGRLEAAEGELLGTLPVARELGQRPLLWRLHADLGQVYRAMGRRADARREFAAARALVQDLATSLPEGALRADFLQRALTTVPAAPVPTLRQRAKQEGGGLTGRERQVAGLIAQGKSNRDIADELVISQKTAERHVANIASKLGLNSRTQIAVWAADQRIGQ
jgi:ATP/maltotriose-dependent transcriptional regulator MalT